MANTYISRTFGTPTNSAIWTLSFWIKRSALSPSNSQKIFSAGSGSTDRTEISFSGGVDGINIYRNIGGSTASCNSTMKFRDTNAWYHLVFQNNNGTVAVYVNGEAETMSSTSLGTNKINLASTIHIFGDQVASGQNFNGLMSHIHFADGTIYAPTVFGSTDSVTGEWQINTSPSFTPGNNGFTILKDGNTITDQSANSNNFTLSSGTLTKTEDCPSNVFATINPLVRTVSTPSFNAGNNTVSSSAGAYQNHFSTIGMTGSGKYYWEMKVNGTANSAMFFGISSDIEMNNLITVSNVVGYTSTGYTLVASSGNKYNNENSTSYGSALTNGEIMMGALDLDNGKIWYGKNGTWFNSGNPASGSNEAFSGISASNVYFVSGTVYDGGYGSVNYNFGNGYFETTAVSSAGTNASGNGIFEYDVPTGYTALSTKGLNT